MPESDSLTKAEIEAAVRILYEEGCFYNWWPIVTKSYEEFAASDRIGISELSGIRGADADGRGRGESPGRHGLSAMTPDSGICLIAGMVPKIEATTGGFELILVGRPSSR